MGIATIQAGAAADAAVAAQAYRDSAPGMIMCAQPLDNALASDRHDRLDQHHAWLSQS